MVVIVVRVVRVLARSRTALVSTGLPWPMGTCVLSLGLSDDNSESKPSRATSMANPRCRDPTSRRIARQMGRLEGRRPDSRRHRCLKGMQLATSYSTRRSWRSCAKMACHVCSARTAASHATAGCMWNGCGPEHISMVLEHALPQRKQTAQLICLLPWCLPEGS